MMEATKSLIASIEPTVETNKRPAPNNVLGKDDFLKLMLVQMKHQDPLEPMDNTESIAQLAQFSSLEQMTNVSENISSLLQAYQATSKTGSLSMIGKQVSGEHDVENEIGELIKEPVTGRVTGVDLKSELPIIVVQTELGPVRIPLNQITEVHQPSTDQGSTAGESGTLVSDENSEETK
jgi:flagellar basal-body rod modification protein FlgD